MENNSYQLKANDILVIRGTGKFIYQGAVEENKKRPVFIFHSENLNLKKGLFSYSPEFLCFFYLKIYQMKHNT